MDQRKLLLERSLEISVVVDDGRILSVTLAFAVASRGPGILALALGLALGLALDLALGLILGLALGLALGLVRFARCHGVLLFFGLFT